MHISDEGPADQYGVGLNIDEDTDARILLMMLEEASN